MPVGGLAGVSRGGGAEGRSWWSATRRRTAWCSVNPPARRSATAESCCIEGGLLLQNAKWSMQVTVCGCWGGSKVGGRSDVRHVKGVAAMCLHFREAPVQLPWRSPPSRMDCVGKSEGRDASSWQAPLCSSMSCGSYVLTRSRGLRDGIWRVIAHASALGNCFGRVVCVMNLAQWASFFVCNQAAS